MDAQKVTAAYRQAHWLKVNVSAYCKELGVSENTYYYWQRKLREEACTAIMEAQMDAKADESAPAGWARCERMTPKTSRNQTTPNGIEIQIGKCRVNINNHGFVECVYVGAMGATPYSQNSLRIVTS